MRSAIEDPRLLLSTYYSSVMDDHEAEEAKEEEDQDGLNKLVRLVTDAIDRLVIAVHQVCAKLPTMCPAHCPFCFFFAPLIVTCFFITLSPIYRNVSD